jgi:hypothetical protein
MPSTRHTQIQQHDIGLVLLHQLDCLRAIPCPAYDHHILRFGQNCHDSIRNNGMIFGDENSDARFCNFIHRFESNVATSFNNPSLERAASGKMSVLANGLV